MLTEGNHVGAYVVREVVGKLGLLSKDTVIVTLTGTKLPSGTVLGKITVTGKYAAYKPDATDGTQTAVAVLHTELPAVFGNRPALVHLRYTVVDGWHMTGLDRQAVVDLEKQVIVVRGGGESIAPTIYRGDVY